MLVFALNLEEIEEVCATGVDLDQVLRRMRRRSGQGRYGEVLRSGDILRDLDGFHG